MIDNEQSVSNDESCNDDYDKTKEKNLSVNGSLLGTNKNENESILDSGPIDS